MEHDMLKTITQWKELLHPVHTFPKTARYARAFAYANAKHAGQTRIGGDPYITHPLAVADIVRGWGYGANYQLAALFHDLLEDTDASEQQIARLGGKQVLKAVKCLTKTPGYQMDSYISCIRKNRIARVVKAADRLHNLRCAHVAGEAFKRKYIKESMEWYLDFSPEILPAVKQLEASL
jgi:(p)ppGpp synthase/HD superfamily hydrolase